MDKDELAGPLHKQPRTQRSVAMSAILSDRLDKLCAALWALAGPAVFAIVVGLLIALPLYLWGRGAR